jgi:hypothetical protein
MVGMICHEFPGYTRQDLEETEDIAPIIRMYGSWQVYQTLSSPEGRKSKLMGQLADYGIGIDT